MRAEQALQVVGPRSVTGHIRRQALESAAESLEPTFAMEFPVNISVDPAKLIDAQ